MFATPFLIGLASSLHCIGMCSPLVMAASKAGKRVVARNVTYNFGRITTYALLGSTVGYMGEGLDMIGIQQGVSLIVGTIILIIAIANINITLPGYITRSIAALLNAAKSKLPMNPFFLGVINGFLPCGMTLAALAYCVTLQSPTDGLLAMVYFGVGTLPAMMGLSFFTRSLINRLPISYRQIQTTLLVISGILLMGRAIELPASPIAKEQDIVICGPGAKN